MSTLILDEAVVGRLLVETASGNKLAMNGLEIKYYENHSANICKIVMYNCHLSKVRFVLVYTCTCIPSTYVYIATCILK